MPRKALRLAMLAAILVAGEGCATTPRVWGIAQQRLPGGMVRVIYVDLQGLAKSELPGWIANEVIRDAFGSKDPVAVLADKCGIDLITTETLFAFRKQDGVVFARIPGVDQATLTACLGKAFGVTFKPVKSYLEIWDGNGEFLTSAQWIAPDVLALALTDRGLLLEVIDGKGGLLADQVFARALVEVDDLAPLWGVILPGSKGMDQSLGFSLRLDGTDVHAKMTFLAGGWLRAWGMAKILRKRMDKFGKDVKDITVDNEGERVVIRVWLSGNQVKKFMKELID